MTESAKQAGPNMNVLSELKRRNVFRVGAAYVVTAWLVIQVVETILPAFGFGDVAVRIVTVTLAIGLIPALILAWVFELTPEGLRKERDVGRAQSVTRQSGKRLDRGIMVVLALAVAYFAFDNFVLDPQREAEQQEQKAAEVEQARQEGRTEALIEDYGEKSIAVLAFQDMSPAGDQGYLSDGIAEELLNLLAGIRELRVISRSSAFSFKGKDVPIPEIARQLNVAHILEGSVRKSGNRIRITAQLIDARADTHLWSKTYDRELEDVFAVQDEIAAAMVDQLRLKLLEPIPTTRKTNPETYTLYLHALQLWGQQDAQSHAEALNLLQQAVVLDPDHADSWALMGKIYIGTGSFRLMPLEQGVPLGLQAARRAIELDPSNGLAQWAISSSSMAQGDLATTAESLQAAAAAGPLQPNLLVAAGFLALAMRDLDQAQRLFEHAIARDPLNASAYNTLSMANFYQGRIAEAKANAEAAVRLNPGLMHARGRLAGALYFLGDVQAALEEVEKEPLVPMRLMLKSAFYQGMGQSEQSDRYLRELVEFRGYGVANWVFAAYLLRGEGEKALQWIEDHGTEMDGGFVSAFNATPQLDGIRQDPRYQKLLRRCGLAPEQLAGIRLDLDLPE
jgi:TolB-like protein/Tfp pilus assembly protein PilF